jgi:hypothetical protein
MISGRVKRMGTAYFLLLVFAYEENDKKRAFHRQVFGGNAGEAPEDTGVD